MSAPRAARALSLALALAACTATPEAPPPAPARPFAVEFAGCAAVREGPICELAPEGTLRLWVAPDAPAGLSLLGATGALAPGDTNTVTVAAATHELRITPGDWRLAVERPAPVPLLDEVAALRKARRTAEARAKIDAALPGAPPELAGRLLGHRARLALAAGEAEAAVADFRAALPLHRAAGRVTDAVNDALALAFVQIHQTRDFAGARDTLAAAEAPARADPESAAALPVHRARLALETGDLRSALAALDDAEPRLARLGATLRLSVARQARAEALQALGRHAEAVALLRTMLSEAPASPCAATSLKNDLAWALMRQAGESPPPAEADALFAAAEAAFRGECPRPADAASVSVNRALHALRLGDAARARTALGAARAALPRPDARLALWSTEIEARLTLLSGDALGAAAQFERLRALGEATVSAEARWRGALGRARALSQAGHRAEAGAAFAEAEALLSDQALEIPLAEGRETFFAEREGGTRDFVEFLVAEGRTVEAMAVVRRARARFLAALRRADRLPGLSAADRTRWEQAIADHQRARAALDAETADDWMLAAPELAAARARRAAREKALRTALDAAFAVLAGPAGHASAEAGDRPPSPPATGEVVLTWFPVATGLLAFAASPNATRVVRLPDTRPEGLLAPFEAVIAAAKRVRVLPYGPVRGLDVHALPFRGAPLITHAAVVYGLDLPPVNKSSVDRRALLVADPRGDLRGARVEADAVEARLKGWTLTRLDGEAATGAAVRDALARTDLFHYAGHGRFAGAMGWDSALPLAADARLGVDDILALPHVPAHVVLSGCETARQAADAPLEAVGLAQAFMVAGAESAIAATRPVDDTLARDLAADLYLHAGAESAEDALRRAQTALAQGPPGRDWAAFRVLVP